MDPERRPNWPEEDVADGRGYWLRSDNGYEEDYVSQNVEFWRNADRGIFSRPLELRNFSKGLHRRILKTFDLPPQTPEPLVTFSLLFDDPNSPSSEYVHSDRFPEGVKDEDKADFSIGIGRITEYATNLAAKEFFTRNYPRPIAEVYTNAADWFTYRLLLGGTYTRMKAIELVAEQNGKDFKSAVLTALFQHDFGPINELVSDTQEFSGWEDINDLAVDIGRHRLKKPDIGKWIGKLDAKRTDQPRFAPIKNTVISTLAAGVYRVPGVTEISGGAFLLFPTTTTLVCLVNLELSNVGILSHPELIPYTMPAVVSSLAVSLQAPVSIVVGLKPFVAVHESIHHYTSNKEYMGMIPARLIYKETTPFKGKLEPEVIEE